VIGLKDDDEDQEDRDVEAEGGLLAVPDGGLPHGEAFAADHHEAGEPEQEGERGADDGEAAGGLEELGGGSEVAEPIVGALGGGERGQGFGGDDGDIGSVQGAGLVMARVRRVLVGKVVSMLRTYRTNS
jgi:hypothetical protein